ncbi:cysteine desulfurase [Stagnimonas aquatica]|uniref:Cysteine desulfurase n=1 Tax=Stagnimonas aquatica TaxID=2689987 RepID=A0A3N0V8V2_9GAMM|nr:cysteine desulfurase family protein [Stagnimonas aquatica]ROH89203.1 cysteine desulfurase [Stagnimonas aquatica]
MPAYLDHNASTAIDPRVLEAMLPYLSGPYGNPSSLHRYGRLARDAVERARAQVAALAGAQPGELIWTSGGTEANNLALKGLCQGAASGRLLYGATEHPAVMEAAESLRAEGWPVEVIAVDDQGRIDGAAFRGQLVTGPLRLVSLMRANNETGVIHDLAPWATEIHAVSGWLHVDATQAAGKLPLDMSALGADLLTLSSHKIYGPKGVGALLVRAEVELHPQLHGGAQEKGLRGGTENLPAIVGFGAAAELAQQELEARIRHQQVLRERLDAGLRALPGTRLFGEGVPRLSNTSQFALEGWDGEALLMHLDRRGYAVSSGSACASGSGEPSHVLLAMGVEPMLAKGAVRVSLGKDSQAAEVDGLLRALDELRLRGSAA